MTYQIDTAFSALNKNMENGSQVIEKPSTNNKKTNTTLLLPLEVKEILNSFYDQYLQEDSICSERLNDVYALYTQFLEKNHSNVEVLKKRSFKLALQTVLKSRNIFISFQSLNTGVLLLGIGIQVGVTMKFRNEMKKKEKENLEKKLKETVLKKTKQDETNSRENTSG